MGAWPGSSRNRPTSPPATNPRRPRGRPPCLAALEVLRDDLAGRFDTLPGEVAVVIHPRLAASRSPIRGCRSRGRPPPRRAALLRGLVRLHRDPRTRAACPRAAGVEVPGRARRSARACTTSTRTWCSARQPDLPPPFTRAASGATCAGPGCARARPRGSGQVHLRAAIVRRLREGKAPSFPPSARDAFLLGGTLFDLLEGEAGSRAAAALATRGARPRAAFGAGRRLRASAGERGA